MITLKTREEIEGWLDSHKVRHYTINEDLSIDVNGSVDLNKVGLKEIPVRFRNVSGYFICSQNKLTNLVGCPVSVGGDFYCSKNKLVSLVGCPIQVFNDFVCIMNRLDSLSSCPESLEIGGDFKCYNNHLTSLVGGPIEIGGDFNCSFNKLDSLEGCPITIGGNVDCSNNKIGKEELFLYDYSSMQLRQYYNGKNLNEKLQISLAEDMTVIKKKQKL